MTQNIEQATGVLQQREYTQTRALSLICYNRTEHWKLVTFAIRRRDEVCGGVGATRFFPTCLMDPMR